MMDGFYGISYDESTGDHRHHQNHNYADKSLVLPSENLLTPLDSYHQDHHGNDRYDHSYCFFDNMISSVLGSADQELRFQSCSGSAVAIFSESANNSIDVTRNRREGVGHREYRTSHNDDDDEQISNLIKAKIASHPSYPKLLDAYIDCQKVGAPLDIASLLDQIKQDQADHLSYNQESVSTSTNLGVDPELDEFMETFCEVLVKCKSDLSRTFNEATSFLSRVETQLGNLICNDESALSSDEEETSNVKEIEIQDLQIKNEDRELKNMLMRKYGGIHINRLKMEFSKNKKKVKLPKEARLALLEWWNLHYKWPYPTEADKISLAESTGLDQKQINNWFINQRKRHWKSSDNIHLAMVDNYSSNFVNED